MSYSSITNNEKLHHKTLTVSHAPNINQSSLQCNEEDNTQRLRTYEIRAKK